jgi:ATP-dependent Clp protease adaptor protein ClpS
MPNVITKPKIKPQTDLAEPPMFRILYINDNQTTVEFVISSLVNHFLYNEVTAEKIALDIHVAGAAIVAVLPFELAEQKGVEITIDARSKGFPLQIKLEPEPH